MEDWFGGDDSLFETPHNTDREQRIAAAKEESKSYTPVIHDDFWYTHVDNEDDMESQVALLGLDYANGKFDTVVHLAQILIRDKNPSSHYMPQVVDILCLALMRHSNIGIVRDTLTWLNEAFVGHSLHEFSLAPRATAAGASYNAARIFLQYNFIIPSAECILAAIGKYPLPRYKEHLYRIRSDLHVSELSQVSRETLDSLDDSRSSNAYDRDDVVDMKSAVQM